MPMRGHKAGCRCVGCSPSTRARGMRALRKAPKRARRNPDARTPAAATAQLTAKAADFARAARKLALTKAEQVLVSGLEVGRGEPAAFLPGAVAAVLTNKELRNKVARSAVGERAVALLEATAKRAGVYLRAVTANPELARWFVYVKSEGAWSRVCTLSLHRGMKTTAVAGVLKGLPGRGQRAAIWASSWDMADRGLRVEIPGARVRSN